jgi:hypothetical protein
MKGTLHQCHHGRPIKDLGFHPEDSPHPQNNGFNKVNQLRLDLGFSP